MTGPKRHFRPRIFNIAEAAWLSPLFLLLFLYFLPRPTKTQPTYPRKINIHILCKLLCGVLIMNQLVRLNELRVTSVTEVPPSVGCSGA